MSSRRQLVLVWAIVRPALRLLVRSWRALIELPLVPRPDDAPHAHASGLDPHRILVFGSGPAVGYGVRSHELALPGHLARELSARTGHGANVDVLADPGLTISSAAVLLGNRDLRQYDAVIVSGGVNDVMQLVAPLVWRDASSALLRTLHESSSPSTLIVTLGIPPIRSIPIYDHWIGSLADRHAHILNKISQQLCSNVRDAHTSFLRLPELTAVGTTRHRSPEGYRLWAEALAEHLSPKLSRARSALAGSTQSTAAPHAEELSANEVARQKALDDVGIVDTAPDERFDKIVELARSLFGTRYAAITFIDNDRQWYKASAGMNKAEIPRVNSFCDVTIRESKALIVPDAAADDRFAGVMSHVDGARVLFYAGYPVESPDGQRIGALCVFDTEARQGTAIDAAQLRDLALLTQHALWSHAQDAKRAKRDG